MEKWEEILFEWKEKYPAFKQSLPLEILTGEKMTRKKMLETQDARMALTNHVQSSAYLINLCTMTHRFDLNGNPKKLISKKHAENARKFLNGESCGSNEAKSDSPQIKPAPVKLEAVKMLSKSIKATVVITDFESHIKINSFGAKTVPIKVQSPSGYFVANLNPKSFRKAQDKFIECKGSAIVMITGELDLKEMKMLSAGISVQPRVEKPSSPDSQ